MLDDTRFVGPPDETLQQFTALNNMEAFIVETVGSSVDRMAQLR